MTAEIGLTGSIGSGKSTAARLLAARGAVVIDADALARIATTEPATVARIRQLFGPRAVAGGVVDRAYLARRVFDEPGARAALEAVVHPRVAELRTRSVAQIRALVPPVPLIVHDVPLLFESGLASAMDAVVVVDAPLAVRVARVAARSGLSEAEILRRDRAQMPPDEKRRLADHVLDNAGDEASMKRQIEAIWPALLAAAGPA